MSNPMDIFPYFLILSSSSIRILSSSSILTLSSSLLIIFICIRTKSSKQCLEILAITNHWLNWSPSSFSSLLTFLSFYTILSLLPPSVDNHDRSSIKTVFQDSQEWISSVIPESSWPQHLALHTVDELLPLVCNTNPFHRSTVPSRYRTSLALHTPISPSHDVPLPLYNHQLSIYRIPLQYLSRSEFSSERAARMERMEEYQCCNRLVQLEYSELVFPLTSIVPTAFFLLSSSSILILSLSSSLFILLSSNSFFAALIANRSQIHDWITAHLSNVDSDPTVIFVAASSLLASSCLFTSLSVHSLIATLNAYTCRIQHCKSIIRIKKWRIKILEW